MKKSTN